MGVGLTTRAPPQRAPAEAMDAASTWHNNTNERITAAMDASIHVAQSMHRVADVLGARFEAALGARLEVGELSLEVGEVLRATVVATAATIVLTTLLPICARRHGPSKVEKEKPVPTEAPAVVKVVGEDGSWQVVDNLAKKRAQKARSNSQEAAAKKQEQEAKKAAEAAAKAEASRALRVKTDLDASIQKCGYNI